MITINLDKSENRVFLILNGVIRKSEAATNLKRFFEALQHLDDNFTIITDLSGLRLNANEELLLLINLHLKTQELFKVGRVIRVVGKSKPLLVYLSKLDQKNNLSNIHYVPTINDAIEFDKKVA